MAPKKVTRKRKTPKTRKVDLFGGNGTRKQPLQSPQNQTQIFVDQRDQFEEKTRKELQNFISQWETKLVFYPKLKEKIQNLPEYDALKNNFKKIAEFIQIQKLE